MLQMLIESVVGLLAVFYIFNVGLLIGREFGTFENFLDYLITHLESKLY